MIGSLYFFRRNRCSTRTSTLGGLVLAMRWRNFITARAYSCARNRYSSSRSRWACLFHTGSAAPIRMAMMLMPTSSAAIA